MPYTVHPTAIVDEGAQIGDGSRVWHFAHVCSGAKIGRGVSLGQNVFVGNKVTIGDYCKIQNNVSVYDNVTLEEGVFCGPSMVFTNVYNPRSLIERKSEYRKFRIRHASQDDFAAMGEVIPERNSSSSESRRAFRTIDPLKEEPISSSISGSTLRRSLFREASATVLVASSRKLIFRAFR